jgi:uncharacterized protein DUF6876
METETKITQSDLDQFTGTEHWYKHWASPITFTDGAKFLAERAGAFWLLDEIVFAQRNKKVKGEEFQVWRLKLDGKGGCTLTCDDGNGNVALTKAIPYTDFPLDEAKVYFTGGVILLPSEY